MGSWTLAEITSRHDTYSRILQQLEAVERIRRHVLILKAPMRTTEFTTNLILFCLSESQNSQSRYPSEKSQNSEPEKHPRRHKIHNPKIPEDHRWQPKIALGRWKLHWSAENSIRHLALVYSGESKSSQTRTTCALCNSEKNPIYHYPVPWHG